MRYATPAITAVVPACCSAALPGEVSRGLDALTWDLLPPLPDAQGFAGAFVGVIKDASLPPGKRRKSKGVLIVAGGANFPEGRPWDGGAKVWFAGTVGIGATFDIDAGNASQSKLASNTYIHIFDVEGGTLLQTVEFHTSCSPPLFLDNRFGASRLVGDQLAQPGLAWAEGAAQGLEAAAQHGRSVLGADRNGDAAAITAALAAAIVIVADKAERLAEFLLEQLRTPCLNIKP